MNLVLGPPVTQETPAVPPTACHLWALFTPHGVPGEICHEDNEGLWFFIQPDFYSRIKEALPMIVFEA